MASAGAARPTGTATSAAAVRAPARARWVRVDSVMVPPREVFLPVEEPGGGAADTEVRSVVSRLASLAPQPPGGGTVVEEGRSPVSKPPRCSVTGWWHGG